MGSTRAFYNVYAEGFDDKRVAGCVAAMRGAYDGVPSAMDVMMVGMRKLVDAEKLRAFEKEMADFAAMGLSDGDPAFLVKNDDSPWIGVFDVHKCDGNVARSKDAMKFSKMFKAPVAAFSVMFSDVMYFSYADAESGVTADHFHVSGEDEEEYGDGYENSFPEILLKHAPSDKHAALREAWEREQVCAEDAIYEISDILGMSYIFDGNEDDFTKGFHKLQ